MKIPVFEPVIGDVEINAVMAALKRGEISGNFGEALSAFEKGFAGYCGVKHGVAVTSGTTALHIAVDAAGIGPGDEVLISACTNIATALAVAHNGALPVPVDAENTTWNLDLDLLESLVTPRTKAVIPVHLYGHPADMDAINAVAAAHGLWVVEDAAEAHFARYKGRPVGGLGTIGTFSFYGNKVITSGEGGAITLNDPDLERRVRLLRGQGMDPERRYHFPIVGYNYRLTNVACALLCAQLERREEIIARRKRVFDAYRRQLKKIPGIGLQPVAPWAEPAPWLFCITVDEAAYGCSRDDLMAQLAEEEIETRPFFIPLHGLPPYRDASRRRGDRLPVTERLGATGMNLPTYGRMRRQDIKRVTEAVRRRAALAASPGGAR